VRDKARLLLKTSRPAGWILAPLVFLLGFTAYGVPLTPVVILQLILLTIPFCLFLYGTNDMYDYHSDKLNPRKTVADQVKVETEYFPFLRTLSIVLIVVLFTSSLLTLNLSNIIGMALLLFFAYAYSAPPLRFKERPPLDSLSNGIIYYYAPVLLGASFGITLLYLPIQVYYITACVMGIHSFSTVMDYSVDKMAGDTTFAVVFGKRVASLFTLIVFTVAFFFSGFLGTVVAYYLLFSAILAGIITIVPSEKFAEYFFYLIGIAFVIIAALEVLRYLSFI
jgi:4-hydroxybenzoate polyprenyltransferase